MIVFDPLWKTMKKNNVTIYALIEKYKISRGQISRLKNNHNVTINTIDMLCKILNCRVQDIIEYVEHE